MDRSSRSASADSLDDAMGDGAGSVGGRSRAARRAVGTRTFVLRSGWWIDTGFVPDDFPEAERVTVTTLSDEYFELLAAHPELARCAALGERVVVVLDGTYYVFQPEEPAEEDSPEDDGPEEEPGE